MGANLQLLPRTDQHFPVRIVKAGQQEHFHMGSGIFITKQAGRDDAGIVKYQYIAGAKIFGKIIKMPMLHGAGIFINHQQPAVIPRFYRMLGDSFFG